MKLGLCLTGGGAKGAFQAGIIKALNENNIIPQVVTGTSIGAVNAYFMISGCYNEMEKYWNEMDINTEDIKPGRIIDNSQIINKLYSLSGVDERIRAAYINYVHIKDKKLSEVIVNVKNISQEEALDVIKYSSLLPSRPEDYYTSKKSSNNFDSKNAFNNFREDVEDGIYEGFNLDGGILNNNLITPLIEEKVDKIIIIGLHDDYVPPEYIYNYYDKKDIVVYRPNIKIEPMDTLRFEKTFCRNLFNRGYELLLKDS